MVSAGSALVFGANAICRYFSYKGNPPSPAGASADARTVEEWIAWEAATLAPAERMLAASEEMGGSTPSETLAALKHLEEKLTGPWLIKVRHTLLLGW